MPLITNTDFTPGTLVVATALNAKFTDVQTATTGGAGTGLGPENFRDESIDALQFDMSTTGGGDNGIVLVATLMVDNALGTSGGTAYTSTINTNLPDPVDHGGVNPRLTWLAGQDLEDNDILRVRWSVFMESVVMNPALYVMDGIFNNDNPVWLIWLQWDITSNALANWVEVPNQGDLRDSFVNAEGSLCSECQATMVVPHGFLTYDGIATPHADLANLTMQRGWSYINETGVTITVYGIRMVIGGIYHPLNSVNTGNANAFAKDNANPGWSGETVTLANARMAAIFMRAS